MPSTSTSTESQLGDAAGVSGVPEHYWCGWYAAPRSIYHISQNRLVHALSVPQNTPPLRQMSGCGQAVASSAAAPSSSQGPNYADMTPVGAPVTVNFSSFQIGSDALPETDPALARTRNATEPDQIHISIGGATAHLALHRRFIICPWLALAVSNVQLLS